MAQGSLHRIVAVVALKLPRLTSCRPGLGRGLGKLRRDVQRDLVKPWSGGASRYGAGDGREVGAGSDILAILS